MLSKSLKLVYELISYVLFRRSTEKKRRKGRSTSLTGTPEIQSFSTTNVGSTAGPLTKPGFAPTFITGWNSDLIVPCDPRGVL